MLTWLIVGELAAVVAAGVLAVHRRGWPGDAPEGPPGPGFAVRWTREPLGALAAPRVMVCKARHVMSVFDGERCVKSYRVAVGSEPGDKQREGDRRTPEGELAVCMKNPNSDFVLSLGLSYPDADDANRGLAAGLITPAEHEAIVAAGRAGTQPPWNTALGGEIMIHGCRCGRDTTRGCIAVDDAAIGELYLRLPLGTPVTILP